jgi:hypothetical protein
VKQRAPGKTRFGLRALMLVFATLAVAISASSQQVPEDQIPPEGYLRADGALVLPLRKVLANRRLMVRDMGQGFAGCPATHSTLIAIQEEMLRTEAKDLESRGFTRQQYLTFWNEAFSEGKTKPTAREKCAQEVDSWTRMLANIRAR